MYLEVSENKYMDENVADIEASIKLAAASAHKGAREAGRKCYFVYVNHYRERSKKYVQTSL